MARHATLIGRKGDQWESISVGSAAEMRLEFKKGKFPGFDRVVYLDTSGTSRRKKGSAEAVKAKPKATPKAKPSDA